MFIPKSFSTDRLIEVLKGRVKSVLECGCSSGFNLYWLNKEMGVEIAGCDKDEKPDILDFPFKVQDLNNKLDYKSKSFDAVLFSATLYQMENIKIAINEAKRIAKKCIVIAEMHEEEPQVTTWRNGEHWRNYKTYFPGQKIEEYPINGWPGNSGTTKLLVIWKTK